MPVQILRLLEHCLSWNPARNIKSGKSSNCGFDELLLYEEQDVYEG